MVKGEPTKLSSVGLFADGTAVAQIGTNTFEVLKEQVDDIVLVSTDEICSAIKDIYNEFRAVSEPSGAMGLAGLKKFAIQNSISQHTLVTIQCGANIDFDRFRYISERTEVGERREAILAVTLVEEKGSFQKFCGVLGDRVISEFNYRHNGEQNAQVFVGVKVGHFVLHYACN
jgi:threonine dehydratase